MIRIFFHGQRVPDWLVRMELSRPDGKIGRLTFICIVAVWNFRQQYHVRAIVSGGLCVIRLTGSKHLRVICQSPGNSGKDMIIHPVPIFRFPFLPGR